MTPRNEIGLPIGANGGSSRYVADPRPLASSDPAILKLDPPDPPVRAVKAPLPANEGERLQVLRSLDILDTAAEEAFDNLVQLAAAICEVPIALVSLVDAERQWFKARVGLNAAETHRDLAFCAHAILQPDLFVVGDTLLDDRFARNPLVMGEPNIRFYAGAPLEMEPDIRLGTFCVIDRRPRQLDARQREVLAALCDHAVALLRLRWTNLELTRTEASYRHLFENAKDAIYVHDLDGAFLALNPAAEQMLGYTSAEALQMNVAQILAPASGSDMGPAHPGSEAIAPGTLVECELISKHGNRIIAEISAQKVVEYGQHHVQAIARDITARKHLERQRADYLAMLAHDIKNPLHIIAGAIDVVQSDHPEKAQRDLLLDAIARNSDTLVSLVTNYLAAAKIEAGEVTLSRKAVDIPELLRRLADTLRTDAEARDVTLVLELPPQLPPVDGDPVALERVFRNLLHNALKFTAAGGRVTTAAHADGDTIRVCVTDTGVGIDAAEISGIFDRYRQAADGHTKTGSGLGLFIVKNLVEEHGGSVHVESSGSGSTFTVALPTALRTAAAGGAGGET